DSNCTDNEKPLHKITFGYDFEVSQYEITFEVWDACVEDEGDDSCTYRPEDQGWGRGSRPVINVSWDNITNEYLPWLNDRTGKEYRLLTESEWEYVARAGTTTVYNTGDTIICGTQAACSTDFTGKTMPVGSYNPNSLGIFDVHGNVWEWVQDTFADKYATMPTDGSAQAGGSSVYRMLRGGTSFYFLFPADAAIPVRSAIRNPYEQYKQSIGIGFRVARTK
ncbi:MAG: formylglycine-generating enzyme family protein, partial [bacterium]|nr:formylglycine-generating enzyme family protein [bacterium]